MKSLVIIVLYSFFAGVYSEGNYDYFPRRQYVVFSIGSYPKLSVAYILILKISI